MGKAPDHPVGGAFLARASGDGDSATRHCRRAAADESADPPAPAAEVTERQGEGEGARRKQQPAEQERFPERLRGEP